MSDVIIANPRYWEEKTENPHKTVFGLLGESKQARTARHAELKRCYAAFHGDEDASLYPGEGISIPSAKPIGINVVHSAIVAVSSAICMHPIRPYVLPRRGDYKVRRQCKALQMWADGVMSSSDVHSDVMPRAFMSGLIFDVGAVHPYIEMGPDSKDATIRYEAIPGFELWLDNEAAYAGTGQEVYRTKMVSREQLAARYPDQAAEIRSARAMPDKAKRVFTDMVELVQVTRLPSYPGADDGVQILCTETATLARDSYEFDHFDFAQISFDKLPTGVFGKGLAVQLIGIQDEINGVVDRLQEAAELGSNAIIVVDENANVDDSAIGNISHAIVRVSGNSSPPQVVVSPFAHQQVFQYLESLIQKAYDIAGVSQLTATNRLPPNVESSVAFQTLLNIETRRYGLLVKQWEAMGRQALRLGIERGKEAERKGYKLKVHAKSRGMIEDIDFPNLPDDSFVLDVYSTADLPQTPSGKLMWIQQMGALPPEQRAQLGFWLDLPDREGMMELETSDVAMAHEIAETMLADPEVQIYPEEFMDLEVMFPIVRQHWMKAHTDHLPQENIDNLTSWLKQAWDEIKKRQEPPPQAPPPPDAQGMAPAPEAPQGGLPAGLDPALLQQLSQ